MESFEVTKNENGFHIDGFPDAVKLVKLDDPKAKRLADLALHGFDLDFALECLDGINLVPEKPKVLREGLWHSAVIHYLKCFGSNESRFSLTAKQIYRGDDGADAAFSYFQSLRDKHLVHDENSYAQCLPGAVVNGRDADYKIAKIVTTTFIGATLNEGNYRNLHLLVTRARTWVVEQYDQLCVVITAELERLSYDELLLRDTVTYRVPMLEDVERPRGLP